MVECGTGHEQIGHGGAKVHPAAYHDLLSVILPCKFIGRAGCKRHCKKQNYRVPELHIRSLIFGNGRVGIGYTH